MKDTKLMINPHAGHPISPIVLIQSFWKNRLLIKKMAWREVIGRYKGSVMGLAWSLFNPLFMLAVYTFVFSQIFSTRWGTDVDSKVEFSLILFTGMIVLTLFSEIVSRSPNLIPSNANYVKKVIFPIEVLPFIITGAALFHSLVSFGVLIAVFVLIHGYLHWTIIFVPIILLPLLVITLALAWLLSSLGVFLRDIGQTIGLVVTMLMFLSPVLYPLSAVPEKFLPYILANPLTFIIVQMREVIIWGNLPDWRGLGIYSLWASVAALAGFAWFQKTRKGFADVL